MLGPGGQAAIATAIKSLARGLYYGGAACLCPTAGYLYHVGRADIIFSGLGTNSAANVDQLRILSASSALIAEDDGPIACPWEAVVERQADCGSGIVGTTIIASKYSVEVGCNFPPNGWTLSLAVYMGEQEGKYKCGRGLRIHCCF